MKKLLVLFIATFAFQLAWAAGDVPSTDQSVLKGEVLEVQDAGAYTYLRLRTVTGEIWAAVSKAPVRKGSEVTIFDAMEMQDFESKSLDRTFPTIFFGTVGVAAVAEPLDAATVAQMPAGHPDLSQIHAGHPKTGDVPVTKVSKAEGATGRTIAEVNADRLALKDLQVTIRATVVKVTANVMGTNWVHLQDGSGSAADSSNDLLVTSKDEPNVGDIVVAVGVVKTDVDFGAGYSYAVLVANASLQK